MVSAISAKACCFTRMYTRRWSSESADEPKRRAQYTPTSAYGTRPPASACAASPMYSGASRLHACERPMIANVVSVRTLLSVPVGMKYAGSTRQ